MLLLLHETVYKIWIEKKFYRYQIELDKKWIILNGSSDLCYRHQNVSQTDSKGFLLFGVFLESCEWWITGLHTQTVTGDHSAKKKNKFWLISTALEKKKIQYNFGSMFVLTKSKSCMNQLVFTISACWCCDWFQPSQYCFPWWWLIQL